MTVTRKEVPQEDQWNLDTLYPNKESWQKEFEALSKESPPNFPECSTHKGKLSQSPQNVLETLTSIFETERKLRKLYTYAHLRHDEDIADNQAKMAYQGITGLYHQFSQETAWLQPELLAMSDEELQQLIAHPLLQHFHFFLEKLRRLKPHTLTAEQEELVALAQQALESPSRAFSAINNADFKFGQVEDSSGSKKPLTHATYGLYIRERDRTLRKNAFSTLHNKFSEYENTLAELLSGQVQGHLFDAKAHRFGSCLEAALYPKNIETSVYRSLIEAVRSKLGVLHRYMNLRKQILGLDELHLYDLYVPLVPSVDMKFSYEEAEELVIESVRPLGSEYVSLLHHGLKSGRWVDRYENLNKRSGAYSSGCYDSMPYILMNFKGILRDVFTLAHEVGHSMHSYYSRQTQPYHYSDYTIFVAEVASTFNEELLLKTLLTRVQSAEERAFLINEKIEDIRGTLFRQTMFAEFELAIHEAAEKRIPLTPQFFTETFIKLNQDYFGPDVVLDKEIGIEWARIPHFYYNFYVYQYATGISAALALSDKVCGDNATAPQTKYLEFLRSGSSDYPLDLLAKAGVDMRTAGPVLATIDKFDTLVTELEKTLAPSGLKC
ncbi:MAG: oligoendopeptidase F [Verrucomicrobia bacterium]|nr:oligoendopeptidase F [Verrucomicrobiota bacterium]